LARHRRDAQRHAPRVEGFVGGIAIDWTALEAAFESHAPDVRTYLDRRNGELITLASGDETTQKRVRDEKDQHAEVEPVPSREQYRMMERFIDTVTHPQLKERLKDSIVGKGAFRRFKDVLGRFPEERKRWFAFRDVLLHRFILDWLKANRIEITLMPAWGVELPMTPSPNVVEGDEEEPTDHAATHALERIDEKHEIEELRTYLLAWARAHGDEYRYLFGPAAFERLAADMAQEFTVFRRRNERGEP
jgi:Uncharacterised protein family (UPF0158)